MYITFQPTKFRESELGLSNRVCRNGHRAQGMQARYSSFSSDSISKIDETMNRWTYEFIFPQTSTMIPKRSFEAKEFSCLLAAAVCDILGTLAEQIAVQAPIICHWRLELRSSLVWVESLDSKFIWIGIVHELFADKFSINKMKILIGLSCRDRCVLCAYIQAPSWFSAQLSMLPTHYFS